MESNPQTGLEGHGRGDDDNRPSIEATLTRAPNLAEHLNWQIQLSDFSVEEVALAEWIIGNLDEKGYLKATVEEVAVQAQAEPEAVEAVLIKIQQLDPAGVAARDLRECLMVQLRILKPSNPFVLRMVEEHIDLLHRRDFKKLRAHLRRQHGGDCCGRSAGGNPGASTWPRVRRRRACLYHSGYLCLQGLRGVPYPAE